MWSAWFKNFQGITILTQHFVKATDSQTCFLVSINICTNASSSLLYWPNWEHCHFFVSKQYCVSLTAAYIIRLIYKNTNTHIHQTFTKFIPMPFLNANSIPTLPALLFVLLEEERSVEESRSEAAAALLVASSTQVPSPSGHHANLCEEEA